MLQDVDAGRPIELDSIVGAVQELGSVLGPLLGAAVLAVSDWRMIFWLNAILGVVLAVLIVRTGGGLGARPRWGPLVVTAVGLAVTGLALAAPDAAGTGAHGFQDRRAVDGLQKGVVLGLVAGELDGVALFGDVDDAATEDVGHALHLLALLAHGAHLDHHELALGVGALGQVDHLDHLDQAVEVLGDLLDDVVRPCGLDGHARQRCVLGGRNGERFNVVAPRREQPDHARERTRFVFEQDGDDVFHGDSSWNALFDSRRR